MRVLLVLTLLLPFSLALAADPLSLWFDKPVSDWEREALPIGNGAQGAVVSGGIAREHIQLNEKTLWEGGPGSKQGYTFGWPEKGNQHRSLAEVQTILREKGAMAPEDAAALMGRANPGYGNYQNFGAIELDFAAPGTVSQYQRRLDLTTGTLTVSYRQNQTDYRREYFYSYPEQALVVRLSASQPGRISFSARFEIPANRSREDSVTGNIMTVRGALHDNRLRYQGQLAIKPESGQLSAQTVEDKAVIRVDGADSSGIDIFCSHRLCPALSRLSRKRPGRPRQCPHPGGFITSLCRAETAPPEGLPGAVWPPDTGYWAGGLPQNHPSAAGRLWSGR